MFYNPDFGNVLIKERSLVTVNVLYYMPDYQSIINEFVWQTLDIGPKYPRISKFLDFWKREIDAVIKEVIISDQNHFYEKDWRHGIVIPLKYDA